MALKVWLPLNGSLENKGISDVKLTSTAFTIENSGKIGKCIKTTNSSSIDLGYNGNQINTGDMSFGGWFKINEEDITSIINSGNYTSTNKAATSNLIGNDSYGGIGLIWSTNNIYNSTFSSISVFATLRTGTVNQSTSSISVQFNQWMHLFVTFQKSTGILSFYKDGVLIGSKTFSDFSDAVSRNLMLNYKAVYGGNAVTFNLPYYVNDVRIYDHCLSPLEVKEISQGLVLHYKLDGFSGGVGENLLSKYVSPGQQNPGVTATAGRTNYYGDYGIIIPAAENADTYFRLFLDKQLEQNVQYTISCEVSGLLSGSYYRFPLFAQNNTAMGVLQLDHNGLCSLTFTMTYSTQSAVTVNGRTVYICFMDDSARSIASGQTAITIKNFKLEKGSVATPWTPSLSEMGIDTTKIPDSSGYENNGKIEGDLAILEDSSRYNYSTYFNGNSYIDTGVGTFNWFDFSKCTIANWIYPTVSMSSYSGSVGLQHNSTDGYYSKCISNTNSSNKFFTNLANGSGWLFINSGRDLPINEWHHLVSTLDGTILKQYLDGQLVKTTTIDWNTAYVASDTRFAVGVDFPGSDEKFTGNYSDIRFYTTALSAEDILDLYHTPANIDNLGGIHGFEMVEDVSGRELLALPWTSYYGTHNKTSISTNYNDKHEWYSNTNSSAGSDYIKINPTGKTYYYDTEISVAAGNQFYIGFERYDVNKTPRSNAACAYIIAIKPSNDIDHQRYFGTINLATDGVNPTDTIALRVLNAWSGTDSSSTKEATIHYLSLREVEGTPQTGKIKQQGQIYTDEFVERNKQASIYQNGFVGGNTFIEK